MSDRPHPKAVVPASPSLETCDALLISLRSQRFVVVRRGGRIPICSAERVCRPLRELRPGERVFYKGQPDQVRAMAVY